MIALICCPSFLSISAIIAFTDSTTSLPISVLFSSACCASVRTACATSSPACFDCGLNFFCRSDANSFSSCVIASAAACFSDCAMLLVLFLFAGVRAFSLRGGSQPAQDRRILEDLADQVFRAGLPVHV